MRDLINTSRLEEVEREAQLIFEAEKQPKDSWGDAAVAREHKGQDTAEIISEERRETFRKRARLALGYTTGDQPDT